MHSWVYLLIVNLNFVDHFEKLMCMLNLFQHHLPLDWWISSVTAARCSSKAHRQHNILLHASVHCHCITCKSQVWQNSQVSIFLHSWNMFKCLNQITNLFYESMTRFLLWYFVTCGAPCAISYSIVYISMLKAPHSYHWVSHCTQTVFSFRIAHYSRVLFWRFAVYAEAGIISLLLFCIFVVELLWLYNIPLCEYCGTQLYL